ncbi:hypothetical protein HU200_055885 [Digitaria exilis]|uniref:DUF1677 family protein n=1 Tax=Digitaria exilis TaxID=1010633 RepID=A0A835ANP1_9POAL|nr:hypothetical protein HU200_055885 [Digitaria exilis]
MCSYLSLCNMAIFVFQMESQDLRRACSEIANKLEKLVTIGAAASNNNPRGPDVASKNAAAGSDEQSPAVETVRCACCGVGEECTAAYIRGVRASFCGDWLCGLCAEAVKERARRDPAAGGVAAALGAHEAECRDFNATTRLNPTLSLAGSMRRIARRSLDRRMTASCQDRRSSLGGGEPAASNMAAVLARSASCDPWFMADVVKNEASGDRRRR